MGPLLLVVPPFHLLRPPTTSPHFVWLLFPTLICGLPSPRHFSSPFSVPPQSISATWLLRCYSASCTVVVTRCGVRSCMCGGSSTTYVLTCSLIGHPPHCSAGPPTQTCWLAIDCCV
ncbi:hypothetical protein IW261DRAFT_817888 [Armillaria novae-zelandiae]|uniref:Uncharacterized protein n=1 Tax=Armillaria novae-zelandiae TaxID=153914 RepID=A0AA39NUI5_9AGAR|nr:hypothetical protein IW261DRAFT_817888 [Armillaria novae-zelandiae]